MQQGRPTVFGVPAIGAAVVVREGRLMALEGYVGRAHDGLAPVVEAVDHVPVVVAGNTVVGLEAAICLRDGELRSRSQSVSTGSSRDAFWVGVGDRPDSAAGA